MDTLNSVRAQLDAIDDALHDLLMRRAQVVAGLAASRAKAGSAVLRPGREAAILRRLLSRHHGPMPRAVLVRLWREMLMASVRQQGPFQLAVHTRDAATTRLATEHFGQLTATRGFATPSGALAAVTSGECNAAVLPFPQDSDTPDAEWWPALDAPQLSVIARLPFHADARSDTDALLVAPGAPDASGDDRTLLLVEALPDAPRDAPLRALAALGIEARLVLLRRAPGLSRFLLDLPGLLATPPALAFPRTRILGGYASPIRGTLP